MPHGAFGLLIGVILGFALVVGDFGDMLIVALFGGIGFVVHRALTGDLDLTQLLGNRDER